MGYKTAPFKVGPDFIDPGHHGKITGKTSFNLDSWMLSKEYNLKLFEKKTKGSDIAVIEGVMGLYDGIGIDLDNCTSSYTSKLFKEIIKLREFH